MSDNRYYVKSNGASLARLPDVLDEVPFTRPIDKHLPHPLV
jgi:hypothetical protein